MEFLSTSSHYLLLYFSLLSPLCSLSTFCHYFFSLLIYSSLLSVVLSIYFLYILSITIFFLYFSYDFLSLPSLLSYCSLSLYFLIILSLAAFSHCSLKFLIVHSLSTFSFTIAIFSHNFVGKRFEMIDYANNILTVEIFFSKSTCRKTFYF